MRRIRLLWQIYIYYVIIIVISLLAFLWYSSRSMRGVYIQTTKSDLLSRANFIEIILKDKFEHLDYSEIDEICEELGDKTGSRITVILPSGRVIGDSEEDPAKMDDHSNRAEIVEALSMEEEYGSSIRYSNTLNKKMLYVALPVRKGDEILGVIRTSFSLESIDRTFGWIYFRITLVGLMVIVLAAIVSLIVSRKLSRPLENIRKVADKFAQGDLDHQIKVPKSREIAAVVEAMNKMAVQLDERIKTVVRQKNELDTVLSSMSEGVLAVDNDQRFIILNQAALELIDSEYNEIKGMKLQEAVRNPELINFIQKSLKTDGTIESQIVFHIDGMEKYLQLHGTALKDDESEKIGALVVLNDVTMMHRLEKVRTDFVANVSHELKTPVTSIKGFVETLLDGALEDTEDAKRFLKIIGRQANRLHAIIDDLLILSKLEQQQDTEINFQSEKIIKIIRDAIQLCEIKSSEKDIKIKVRCDEELTANMNSQLLEQALVNLLDNAIKYSDPSSEVEIIAERTDGEVSLSVRDHGQGIERKLLPRLFERFYRVDKARSRSLGGTGLGLSIVKHIIQVHKGSVSVESEVGKGSTFTIHLPID